MANTDKFQNWIKLEHARAIGNIERSVDEEMRPENLIIEYGDALSE